jgi:hypothetical protein
LPIEIEPHKEESGQRAEEKVDQRKETTKRGWGENPKSGG